VGAHAGVQAVGGGGQVALVEDGGVRDGALLVGDLLF
jgi:hypothetical protein